MLFAAPTSNFKRKRPGQADVNLRFYRIVANNGTSELYAELHGNLAYMYAQYLSSIFVAVPPGDLPTRQAFQDAISIGAIPVIFDWTTGHHIKVMMNGLLTRSICRIEDLVVILNSDKMKQDPEYVFYVLLKIATTPSELARRQACIREVADYLVFRVDERYPDAWTLAFGLLERTRQEREAGTLKLFQIDWPATGPQHRMPPVDYTGVCPGLNVSKAKKLLRSK